MDQQHIFCPSHDSKLATLSPRRRFDLACCSRRLLSAAERLPLTSSYTFQAVSALSMHGKLMIMLALSPTKAKICQNDPMEPGFHLQIPTCDRPELSVRREASISRGEALSEDSTEEGAEGGIEAILGLTTRGNPTGITCVRTQIHEK